MKYSKFVILDGLEAIHSVEGGPLEMEEVYSGSKISIDGNFFVFPFLGTMLPISIHQKKIFRNPKERPAYLWHFFVVPEEAIGNLVVLSPVAPDVWIPHPGAKIIPVRWAHLPEGRLGALVAFMESALLAFRPPQHHSFYLIALIDRRFLPISVEGVVVGQQDHWVRFSEHGRFRIKVE